MRYLFTFKYGHAPLTEHQHAVLAARVRDASKLPVPGGVFDNHYWQEHAGDVAAILREAPGLSLEVKSGEVGVTLVEALVDKIHAAVEAMTSAPGRDASGHQWNQRVNVHVPGLGLLLMNEVRMMENACTDELSRAINDGWRILAICPQPDQRRPDYVLGRSVPETD